MKKSRKLRGGEVTLVAEQNQNLTTEAQRDAAAAINKSHHGSREARSHGEKQNRVFGGW
jgi:hypothetical protein